MIQVYTIKELVETTGVARTTIHFYLRLGLLPRAQKTAASRSLYTDDHVRILKRIAELKDQGLALADIERELQERVDEANEAGVDLAAQEYRRMHERMLAFAGREFATNGYKNTHVTAIMRALGITATMFYSHFPSKRQLLVECVSNLMDWSEAYADSRHDESHDPAERLLWNIFAHSRAFELGSAALALMRVEGSQEDAVLQARMEAKLVAEVGRIGEFLDAEQDRYPTPSRFPAEPLALTLFTSYQPLPLPGPFAKYTFNDLLEAYLWLFLAAQAARNGEVDIDSRLQRYRALISKLTSGPIPVPSQADLDEAPRPAGRAAQAAPYTKDIVPPSG